MSRKTLMMAIRASRRVEAPGHEKCRYGIKRGCSRPETPEINMRIGPTLGYHEQHPGGVTHHRRDELALFDEVA